MRSGYFGTEEEPCACCAGHTNLILHIIDSVNHPKKLELVKQWASFGLGLVNWIAHVGFLLLGERQGKA